MSIDKVLTYLQARLLEPSSIRGFVWLLAGSGIIGKGAASDISPPEAILALAAIAAGLLGMFTKDHHVTVEHVNTIAVADSVENAEIVIDSAHTIQHVDSAAPTVKETS